jgi:hypothetical protein
MLKNFLSQNFNLPNHKNPLPSNAMKYIIPVLLLSLFAAPFFITDPISAQLIMFILVFFVYAITV